MNGLAGLTEALVADISKALEEAGSAVQVEAQHLITEGAVSGRHHVASRPGEPPNNNLGTLANNIESVLLDPLRVQISSNAPYAAALEFGTTKMEPRPYMMPATEMVRADVTQRLATAVKAAVRKHLGG